MLLHLFDKQQKTIRLTLHSHSFFGGKRSLLIGWEPRSLAAPTESVARFDDMVFGTQRKYYMLGGKGGVGKTSCVTSLAVKIANNGHPTLVVSTDPTHFLSDSFAQDLTGGQLVPVEGPDYPHFALEINPEKAREEFAMQLRKMVEVESKTSWMAWVLE